ncbi:nucleotide sugar dehydrogenase [Halobacteriaceae archaeon GCM10025711]
MQLYHSDATAEAQRTALTTGEVPVAVYGLGKMGLPLASVYADVTGNVVGADVDPDVVRTVNRGESHVENEPGLDALVESVVSEGAFVADSDPEAAAEAASVHVIIVPTLIDDGNQPDLSIIESVVDDIAAGLEPGDMVIAESTLPPRTTTDVLRPHLEQQSGLDRDEFGLAFCPERTSSGRAIEDIRGAYPKVVGGVDDESTRVAELIYGEINDQGVITVSDATTAEAVKLFEGLYRDVNIALANELATHADALDIDVTEAIDTANTQPFCDIHTPGAGVGGHCIPYYPYFLIDQFAPDTDLLETAREVNESMPAYTAAAALDALAEEGIPVSDAHVLVLGLTYRPGVAETRATPALPIVDHLSDAGATVTAVDPLLDDYSEFLDAGADAAEGYVTREGVYDAVVLVTAHETFDDLDVEALGRDGDESLVLVDGRQAMTELQDADGINYRGVGINA